MAEPRTVWVLTAGSFAYYHVVAVFSTRENAEAAKAAMPLEAEPNDPEEYRLDELPPPRPEVPNG